LQGISPRFSVGTDPVARFLHCHIEMPQYPADVLRWFWYHNELLFDAARDAIRSLASAGMPVVLPKGAAIAVSLCEHALRPMQDVDLLVNRIDFRAALGVLQRPGWTGSATPPTGWR